MVSIAISIIAFIVVVYAVLGIGSLLLSGIGLLANLGSNTYDNKSSNLLSPVYRAMKISNNITIPLDINEEDFEKGIEIYYSVLEDVFNHESPEERIDINKSINSPSKKLMETFFNYSGLPQSIKIITADIGYVMEGSGWTKYKECLTDSLGNGKLSISKNKHYKITFSKELYVMIDEYNSAYESDSYSNDPEWTTQVIYKNKQVLNHYPNSVFLYKPDKWIFVVRRVAHEYAKRLDEMNFAKNTETERNNLFR